MIISILEDWTKKKAVSKLPGLFGVVIEGSALTQLGSHARPNSRTAAAHRRALCDMILPIIFDYLDYRDLKQSIVRSEVKARWISNFLTDLDLNHPAILSDLPASWTLSPTPHQPPAGLSCCPSLFINKVEIDIATASSNTGIHFDGTYHELTNKSNTMTKPSPESRKVAHRPKTKILPSLPDPKVLAERKLKWSRISSTVPSIPRVKTFHFANEIWLLILPHMPYDALKKMMLVSKKLRETPRRSTILQAFVSSNCDYHCLSSIKPGSSARKTHPPPSFHLQSV